MFMAGPSGDRPTHIRTLHHIVSIVLSFMLWMLGQEGDATSIYSILSNGEDMVMFCRSEPLLRQRRVNSTST
jgi:hypothetical protein